MATKAKTPANAEVEIINLPRIEIKNTVIRLVGNSPLLVHAWSEKAKKEILGKQTKTAKTKDHDIRNPAFDYVESLYWLSGKPDVDQKMTPDTVMAKVDEAIQGGATFGFPAVAFKDAAVSAGYRAGVIKNRPTAFGFFHINQELIEIHGTPTVREDMVRLSGVARAADLRYRGVFQEWWCDVPVSYNSGAISAEQLVNLFQLGGFACGVGEWRIEKGGVFGGFHVE